MATKKPTRAPQTPVPTTKGAYDALLPQLTAAYQTLPPEEKDRVALLDAAFHGGQEAGFVAWARSVLPGAFPGWTKSGKKKPFQIKADLPPQTIRVDLKWGLWSVDEGNWEDRAPGVWKQMRAAFMGKGPRVTITTAPGKEIRFGTVEIERGRAWVTFQEEWDEVGELAAGWLDSEDRDFARFEKWVADNVPLPEFGGSPGVDVRQEVTAKTFPALMKAIDELENTLIATSSALYGEMAAHVRKMLIPRITGKRRKFPSLPSHGLIDEEE